MAKDMKADLTLLKRLMLEFEASLEEAYEYRDNEEVSKTKEAYQDFVIMLAKSSGYLLAIINESNLLTNDLAKLSQVSSASFTNDADLSIASILKKGLFGGNNDAN